MTVDIQKLKELRKDTGVSIAFCRQALEESNNNLEEAKKLLKKWGSEVIDKKKERKTSEGAIFSYVHHNQKTAGLVELLCETDFVAKNSEFQRLGQDIAMQLVVTPAENLNDLLTKEYIRDPEKKIKDLINEAIAKFGENIRISRFLTWTLAK